MGFGSGYSRRSDNGGKRYSNDMVAHVWNAQSEEAGQSGNGNFYFRGRTLYSYGSHFVVGFIMPDGVAILNADSYSISTSGHQSDAHSAIKNRRWASVASLTDLAGDWKLLPALAAYVTGDKRADSKAEIQAKTRRALMAHATALAATILPAGASAWRWNDESSKSERIVGDTEVGAYLANLAGLPAASWPKIKREAAKLAARVAADKVKADATAAEKRALRLADMPAREWRNQVARMGTQYDDSGFVSTATELRRARKLMLAATRGKLASKARLATVRARLKQMEVERDRFAAMRQPRLNRERLAVHLASVRAWRDASPDGRLASASYHGLVNLERAADALAANGRLARLKASAATLAEHAKAGAAAVATEEQRLRELERVNRAKAEAERKALWLAGQPVGRVNFDAESGGAAMRVVGDRLETSHGAEVPLSHAVKAFRFVKLMRERGESWHRNGHTIRVGHFQVDYIGSDGSFRAGCHSFTWPEVERVAKAAGVFDCEASAEASVPSSVAA